MQNNWTRSYNCDKHTNEKIMFICAVNDWHFEPLCKLCTPQHTQNHNKRYKINIQSFDQINKKSVQRQPVVSEIYKKQIQKVDNIMKKYNSQQQKIIKDLKQMQNKIIIKIKQYFEQISKKIKQRIERQLKENNQKVLDLRQNIQKEIKCIKQISKQQLNIYDWKNSCKKIYFQNKLQTYIEESNQILQQYQEKCLLIVEPSNKNNKQLNSKQSNKNSKQSTKKQLNKQPFNQQTKLYQSIIALINTQVKTTLGSLFQQNKQKPINSKNPTNTNKSINTNKPNQKQFVKRPIIKTKSKTCKNCNQQMEYLTQNKKHLICRFCNMKQRNYTKKPI